MVSGEEVFDAYGVLREALLAERTACGYWEGELASSALATATAVSALAIAGAETCGGTAGRGYLGDARGGAGLPDSHPHAGLIAAGIGWLAEQQNADGGWGDAPGARSNIACTMLVRAAYRLAGVAERYADQDGRAAAYVERCGGLRGLRQRYGRDKTFAVPILTNAALAGMVAWEEVDPLPFELAALPQSWFRFLRLPVVSYAIPALVAIGLVRHVECAPRNPLLRLVRGIVRPRVLRVLDAMQPASGGFLEATPLTSFVVMSLAASGCVGHPVVQRGLAFLRASVRRDGSWPIDTNLAAWVTTLSVNALAAVDQEPAAERWLDWLLSCQHQRPHPYTGAAPGGWGWSDLSGAVPDADDTAGALVALAHAAQVCVGEKRRQVEAAAAAGMRWLLDLQNADGGWPTFCRGWGKLPFDRSGTDLTAHSLRALAAWQTLWGANGSNAWRSTVARSAAAAARGFAFLRRAQQPDGAWLPLWFGNEWHPEEANPVYGTARVLLAYEAWNRLHLEEARRGLAWLIRSQTEEGGWGGGAADARPSVEETALAVEALAAAAVRACRQGDEAVLSTAGLTRALERGTEWLLRTVATQKYRDASPIGLYFAKLWYYERLYPLIFATAALGRVLLWQDGLARARAVSHPLPTTGAL
jgi:squalene-hopene/tetraprenyl-beta-curcumene cyclase